MTITNKELREKIVIKIKAILIAGGRGELVKKSNADIQTTANDLMQLISDYKDKAVAERDKNIASWLKYTGDVFGKACNQCGGPLMVCRSEHPGGETRLLCPTCLDDIRRNVIQNLQSAEQGTQLNQESNKE